MTVRAAFVMPGVGVEKRGAEAFVVELCSALAAEPDLDVHLLCRRPLPGVPFRQIRIRALPRDAIWLRRLYTLTVPSRKVLDTLFLDPLNLEWDTAALAAFPHLWRQRYDVVVMEGGLVGGWLCRLLRRLRGTPFVDVAHGLSQKWETAFARQGPDRVVTFTRTAADLILERAPQAPIEVIPHGVDLELFSPRGSVAELDLDRPVVLAAGAVDEHKRMDLAVRAVAAMSKGSLLVLGEGTAARELDALGARLLGPGRYRRRVVERTEMASHYRAADVVTLPSRSESFGLVYLEGMACGRPCVAPGDEVRREVLGDGALFCDPADRDGYAAALEAAVAADFADRPRHRAERFPFARTARSYADLLRRLAPSHDGPEGV